MQFNIFNKKDFEVTVIISSFNAGKTLKRAIDSVLVQTFPVKEIVLVDDGSTDDTYKILEPYIQDKSIIYIYQENSGCGLARNVAANIAQGKYLSFLDADDYWHPEKLERQMEIFFENSNIIVCYTDSNVFESGKDEFFRLKRNNFSKQRNGFVGKYFAFHNIITLSSSVVLKDVFLKYNGFIVDYHLMMVADLDLWLKLSPHGEFHGINLPLTFYQLSPEVSYGKIQKTYKDMAEIYIRNVKNSNNSIFYKFWYGCGWFRSYFMYNIYRSRIMYFIKKIKKTKLIVVFKEITRRVRHLFEWVYYPILIPKINTWKKGVHSIDEIIDFTLIKNKKIIVLGQKRSEIKSALEKIVSLNPKAILEIGTANGGNLFVLSQTLSREGVIISLDLPRGPWGGGYYSFKKYLYRVFVNKDQKINFIRDNSHNNKSLIIVKDLLKDKYLDILFIDGDHTYNGVRQDFEMYSPLVRSGGFILFHDIADPADSDFGVKEFWNEIKSNYENYEYLDKLDQIGYGIGLIVKK